MSDSALRQAIKTTVTDSVRPQVMQCLRGTIVAAWTKAALEEKEDVKQAAEARCYAKMLKEVDDEIGNGPVAVISKPPRVIPTTPEQLEVLKRQIAERNNGQSPT